MGIRLSEKQFEALLEKRNSKNIQDEKESKYHNKKIVVDGVRYDSKKEYQRHCFLMLREKAKEISNLRFHDKKDTIILQENPKIKYEPDFCYTENGVEIIEDLKGYQTKEFKLKKKMIIGKINSGEINAVLRLTKYVKGNFIVIEEYSKK